jgi:DNA-binding NarL/FixJ family response regulator
LSSDPRLPARAILPEAIAGGAQNRYDEELRRTPQTEGSAPLQNIRVLVADDHDLFRVGLASALAPYPDLEVVAQASRGTMAVRIAGELRPDVVLMDMRLPDIDGPAAIEAIVSRDESVRVVALTVMADDADISAAVDAGACGYLLKDSPLDDVVAAIRAAAGGTAWLSPRAAQALLRRLSKDRGLHRVTVAHEEQLSVREAEVLRLIARGLDNNEIAAELLISPRTAKNHVSSILGKLGVANRIQAAVYAVRTGMD